MTARRATEETVTHPFVVLFAVLTLATQPAEPASAPTDSVLLALREQAMVLAPLVRTPLARLFLAATAGLPPPPVRTLYRDPVLGDYYGETEARSLPDSIRTRLLPHALDGRYFYQTRYGSPLNYARVVELAALAGIGSFDGKQILDFGYGRICHLRLLASLGATVVGVDVDPMLRALYAEPGDQGAVQGFEGRAGWLQLVHGSFPGDAEIRAAVGGDFDIVLSKNTLKGGHAPHERARQSQIVNLGVDDSVFVREIYQRLKPGGCFLMYNLSSPRGNGRCPFSESLLRSAGFGVSAYDQDDSPGARAMLGALGRDAADVDSIKATYTLARRPERPH